MNILKSKTGKINFIAIYSNDDSVLLSDNDIHNKTFQIDLVKIIDLKTKQVFTPEEFFQKEDKIIA